MKKIYISGKITGLDYEDALRKFNEAEEFLKLAEHEVVNPMTIEHNHDKTWESYMKVDLIEMLKCDVVYMLKNWHDSKGARMEFDIAEKLGIQILFQ
jgi:hypothetical protein